jgi:hypothetical protein
MPCMRRSGGGDVPWKAQVMIIANDAWEFCTNGYPDPRAWVHFLKLMISNGERGCRMYGGMTGRGYSQLVRDAKSELRTMGATDEL